MKISTTLAAVHACGLWAGTSALPTTTPVEPRQLLANLVGDLLPLFKPIVGLVLPDLQLPPNVTQQDVELPASRVPQAFASNAPRYPTYPQPTNKPSQPVQLPSKLVQSLDYNTEPMTFLDSSGQPFQVIRDLGFTSVLDKTLLWSFGDTLVGTLKQNYLTAVDSVAVGRLDNRLVAQDHNMDGPRVNSFIPLNQDEIDGGGYAHYSFGGTQIIEVSPGNGLVYYLKNHRNTGDTVGTSGVIIGAGVARVTLDNGIARAERVSDHMWSASEPRWGDTGVTLDATEGYIYLWGRGPATNAFISQATFMARVPQDQATDVSAYEYYRADTRTWTRQRFGDGSYGTLNTLASFALFGSNEMNQAAPFWSNHWRTWMWLYGTNSAYSDVYLKTAPALAGPWTDRGVVARSDSTQEQQTTLDLGGNGWRYAIQAHPEFDDSGKTVYVTWTDSNHIWGVTVEWVG